MEGTIRVRRAAAALGMGLALLLSGCGNGGEAEAMALEPNIRVTAEVADPEGALRAIRGYLREEGIEDVMELDAVDLREIMGITVENIEEYYVCYSDPTQGLANIAMIVPSEDAREDVRNALYAYQERCIQEYMNYDILGSYTIAQEAEIYDQGDYIILLMLSDTEAAQAIIDDYIPH